MGNLTGVSHSFATVFAIVLLIAACDSGADLGKQLAAEMESRDRSGGAAFPAAAGVTVPDSGVSLWELTSEARIDGMAEDLVPINWLAVSSDQRIAVAQGYDRAVRFFAEDGTPVGSFGREGEGPGEFTSVTRAGWLEDNLWVYDSRQRRFTIISPELTLAGIVSAPDGATSAPEDQGRFPESSYIYPQALYPDSGVQAVVMGGGDFAEVRVFGRVSSDGIITDMVAQVPRVETSIEIQNRSGIWNHPLPFVIEPEHAVAADGSRIAVLTVTIEGADAGTYRVDMLDAAGDTLYSRRYGFRAVEIPRAVADSAIADRLSSIEHPDLARAYHRDARVPPVYPPVRRLVIGRDGSLWIEKRRSQEGRPYLVLDSRGEPIGRVLAPLNASIRVADLDDVWTVESDEYGVESVVRYRLEHP